MSATQSKTVKDVGNHSDTILTLYSLNPCLIWIDPASGAVSSSSDGFQGIALSVETPSAKISSCKITILAP